MKTFKKFLPLIAVLFAVAGVAMAFLPAISKLVNEETLTYTGLQIVFGYKASSTILGMEVLDPVWSFSFMNLLPYVLLIAGAVCAFLGWKGNGLMKFVSIACFAAAAVLFFMTTSFLVPAWTEDEIQAIEALVQIGGKTLAEQEAEIRASFSLGIGSILSGVFAGVSAVACVAEAVIQKR